MNQMKFKYFFKVNYLRKNNFLKILSKSKFTRHSQPGLSRYNWEQQDYVKANWEVYTK